jgi:predicted small secreted protein
MKRPIILIPALAIALLAGCNQQQSTGAGPAQQAGKAIDDAGARVADQLHAPIRKAEAAADQARDNAKQVAADASRSLDAATEEVGKKVERAGEKIQQAAH